MLDHKDYFYPINLILLELSSCYYDPV